MASVRKCPKCGLDVPDVAAKICPVCGTPVASVADGKIWIGALFQFAFASIFMLLFHFPKVMILIFGGMILIGTALSAFVKPSARALQAQPLKPLSHPVLFRIVSVGIALSTLAIVCVLLFGFVIFLNSWNRWHQYEGQPYHRSEFQVTRVYYQKYSKGYSVYASGMVDGQREWMSLRGYLFAKPRSQGELEEQVPAGTSIPIYLFPGLKGQARVEVYRDVPPAEASHREAITAVNDSLLGLAMAGGLLFMLTRVRRACLVESEVEVQRAGFTS